jgi:hypothetical protein
MGFVQAARNGVPLFLFIGGRVTHSKACLIPREKAVFLQKCRILSVF